MRFTPDLLVRLPDGGLGHALAAVEMASDDAVIALSVCSPRRDASAPRPTWWHAPSVSTNGVHRNRAVHADSGTCRCWQHSRRYKLKPLESRREGHQAPTGESYQLGEPSRSGGHPCVLHQGGSCPWRHRTDAGSTITFVRLPREMPTTNICASVTRCGGGVNGWCVQGVSARPSWLGTMHVSRQDMFASPETIMWAWWQSLWAGRLGENR
jgi:hypothetical protein